MPTIPRVDDGDPDPPGHHGRGPGNRGANDDRADPHGLDVQRGVEQSLTLARTGSRGAEREDLAAQPMHGRLEAATSPGGILEKDVRNHLPGQQLLSRGKLFGNGEVGLRRIEKGQQPCSRKPLDLEEVLLHGANDIPTISAGIPGPPSR